MPVSFIDGLAPRELFARALAGAPLAHYPVMTPYVMLSNADHWVEVTGEPVWRYYELKLQGPEAHLPYLDRFIEAMPFDLVQPLDTFDAETRRSVRIVHRDGRAFFLDKRDDSLRPVPEVIHEAGSGGGEVEVQTVFTKADVRAKYPSVSAQQLIDGGINEYNDALVGRYGKTYATHPSCIINTLYACSWSVGMTNLFAMLIEEPELIHYLSEHILARNMETIRAIAQSGVDFIYLDDACATSDMISRRAYEEFSFPYMKHQVEEIHRLKKKCMVIYFGGIEDRADLINELGADLIVMESAMKGYLNRYDKIAPSVTTGALAGNLNPYEDLERATDLQLRERLNHAIECGRRFGRYVTSTGSPITPNTPVKRIQDYICWAHSL